MLFHLTDLASPGVSLLVSPYIAWITKFFITFHTEFDKGSSFPTLIIKSRRCDTLLLLSKIEFFPWLFNWILWFQQDLLDKVHFTRSTFLFNVSGPYIFLDIAAAWNSSFLINAKFHFVFITTKKRVEFWNKRKSIFQFLEHSWNYQITLFFLIISFVVLHGIPQSVRIIHHDEFCG